MAQIKINEISNNYSYNIGNSSYCTVALPITACWGPAFMDLESIEGDDADEKLTEALESVTWQRFSANQAGLESFVATYRGASSVYRRTKDYSYQMALTLLTRGYDVLVSRVCPGAKASNAFVGGHYEEREGEQEFVQDGTLNVTAKYPGTFGNNILVTLKNVKGQYWNALVYALDASGIRTPLENLLFTLNPDNGSDTILYLDEIESNYVTFQLNEEDGKLNDQTVFLKDTPEDIYSTDTVIARKLINGTDTFDIPAAPESGEDTRVADLLAKAQAYAIDRYKLTSTSPEDVDYVKHITGFTTSEGVVVPAPTTDVNVAASIKHREWTFTSAIQIMDLLKDRLTYNPNRVISPWDDQNFYELGFDKPVKQFGYISPMHIKLMDVAYTSRCATAYLDIPKSVSREGVWNDSDTQSERGYAQLLSSFNINDLYTSHSALFAPWGQYTYIGMSRQAPATPSFMALLIQRAMILNQANQYEWAMPTSRANNVKFGKLDYTVPHDLLDKWQSTDGTSLNIITTIPGLGTSLWGNSTLIEVPPATYQALGNLSTRLLINAIKDVVYKVGIGITYQYNNSEAYARFYAGVTPLLDTMSNVGALIKGKDVEGAGFDDPGYSISMAADINGLDSVNANSVVGTIKIRVAGIINNITIDLIALPQTAAL